jgi:hypothetical protein
MTISVHEGYSLLVHERPSRGGKQLWLVNMHFSANSNDYTRYETKMRTERLITQQPAPYMERLEVAQIFSEQCGFHHP